MKIAVQTIAFNEEQFIGPCIEQFQGLVDEHFVLLSEAPRYALKDQEWKKDRTEEIANSLGATVVKGIWAKEQDQRNEGLLRAKNYDWVLIVDADEFYTQEDFRTILKFLEDCNDPESDSPPANVFQLDHIDWYWKDLNHKLKTSFKVMVPIAMNPNGTYFSHMRDVLDTVNPVIPVTMHHMSLLRKNLREKYLRTHYGLSEEWLAKYNDWDEGNLVDGLPLPYDKKGDEHVVVESAPQEIINLLQKWEKNLS